MKLVSLNAWGAAQNKIFFDYILELSNSVDIFCFQELFISDELLSPKTTNLGWRLHSYKELQNLLPNFQSSFVVKSSGYADDSQNKASFPVKHGQATFIKNNFKIENYSGGLVTDVIYKGTPPVEGNAVCQISTLNFNQKPLNIVNFHGMSRPGDKLDTPERILQSEKLMTMLSDLSGEIILCGDFNLMPETKSVKIIESKLENLITKFKITNTRNQVSWDLYKNKQYFADFTFVSRGVKIKHFEVPYNLVSDHLPMILEFEI